MNSLRKNLAVYERYEEKISTIEMEPYEFFEDYPENFEKLEESNCIQVTSPDLYEFLVNRTSFYTHKEIRCYKALEAYNTFISGWTGVPRKCVVNSCTLLMCEVSTVNWTELPNFCENELISVSCITGGDAFNEDE